MSEEKATNQWKEVTTTWDGQSGYVVRNPAGGLALMGKDKDGNLGIGPMEMLLAGLAGCTAMDMLSILEKKRQKPEKIEVRVLGNQRTDDYPMFYTEFKVEYLLWGENLKEKDVAQAIQLSEEKYCSVGGTLAKAGPIHSTFQIIRE
ncbi:MAG: OsmC family protein [Anaerolineales bacterium]